MSRRVSQAQRIRTQSVAEREVIRFAGNHVLWHKHVHNVALDPVQVLKMVEMDEFPNTVDNSCRRTGKTAVKELYLLEHNATHADQELGIVAPREAQALTNLNYHLDAIRRSAILTAWVDWSRGRRQIADTYYQLANRSRAQAYGIMAQVDGGDLTAASLEEVDDMPAERLYSRFLLMMGATRRLGASKHSENRPQIRITGVFKGADTLQSLLNSEEYHLLPTVNVHLASEMGILDPGFMDLMRRQLSPNEYIRQLLCLNVSAQYLIHEARIRSAMTLGLASGYQPAAPLPGDRYKKRGLISFGYDASGHGEQAQSSRHALVVAEQLGNFIAFPFARTWPPGTDEPAVMRDLVAWWSYFHPDTAIGDAYGVGMITAMNDDLYARGLTQTDRRAIGDGQSTATNWPEWPFAPMRFEGFVKHQMARNLRSLFHDRRAVLPYLDDLHPDDPDTQDLRLFARQLSNIRADATRASYDSYRMVSRDLGDDLFDAALAAVHGLMTRGAILPPSVVLIGNRSREQLLGLPDPLSAAA